MSGSDILTWVLAASGLEILVWMESDATEQSNMANSGKL